MADIRLTTSASALLIAILGYVALVITGHSSEAEDLLKLVALPSLTWILGAGSTLVVDKNND